MAVVAIIPARYAAVRLPGKPLLDETGKPLIVHVVENAGRCARLERVIVATDDERIRGAVEAFGGEAVMTAGDHRCGTDRIAEAAGRLDLSDGDVVINIQGDEPEIPPECIEALVDALEAGDAPMATLATPIDAETATNPNRVKVVLARDGSAMYFSRARIPFDRDGTGDVGCLWHLGVYAYRAGFLKRFTDLSPTPAEQAEKLEQLRALEHGERIAVAVVDYDGIGIDTPEDYAAFVARAKHGDG